MVFWPMPPSTGTTKRVVTQTTSSSTFCEKCELNYYRFLRPHFAWYCSVDFCAMNMDASLAFETSVPNHQTT
jgi:hypothetical protein